MKMQVCPECDVAGGRGGPGGPGGASAGFRFGGAGRRNSPRASKDPDLEDSKNAGWPDDSGHGPARPGKDGARGKFGNLKFAVGAGAPADSCFSVDLGGFNVAKREPFAEFGETLHVSWTVCTG